MFHVKHKEVDKMKILLTDIDLDIIFADEDIFTYVITMFKDLRRLFGVVQVKFDKESEEQA